MNGIILPPLGNWVDKDCEWLLTSQKEAARHHLALDRSTQHGLWHCHGKTNKQKKNSNLSLIKPLELITGAWTYRAQSNTE